MFRWIVLLVVGALSACAQNPVSGDQDFVLVSEEQEVRMGRQADQEVKRAYPIYDHKTGDERSLERSLAGYVEELGKRLTTVAHRQGLEYRFTVLDSTDINAFALPGGYTYFSRGLIAYLNSEAELAAVMGHELGHVTARHSVKRASNAMATDVTLAVASILLRAPHTVQQLASLGAGAFLARYSREDELQADRLGAEYVARIGLNPNAAAQVVKVLKAQEGFDAQIAKEEGRKPRDRHGVFASHPDNESRLNEITAEARRIAQTAGIKNAYDDDGAGRERFLTHIDGMVFGDNTAQGVVRNNEFFHADLGIALKFPPDWRIVNRADRVVAIAPLREVEMTLLSEEKIKDKDPAEMLKRGMNVDGPIEINPLPGMKSAIATGSWSRTRAAIYVLGEPGKEKGYSIAALARNAELLKKHLPVIDATLKSFRATTDADKKLAQPLRIRVITADANTRYAELAKTSPIGKHAEAQLRLMNAHYPMGEPVAGQKLKIVE